MDHEVPKELIKFPQTDEKRMSMKKTPKNRVIAGSTDNNSLFSLANFAYLIPAY